MNTIWKFPLEITDEQVIQLPAGAELLTVTALWVPVPVKGVPGERPCLWALVDDECEPTPREIRIYGTGHAIKVDLSKYKYVGTFQVLNGSFVGHVFEKLN
jgi:hypothetical protein